MIVFNELRVTPDRKHLLIDVEIENLDYYADNYLEYIIIDTQKDFNITGGHMKKDEFEDPFYIEIEEGTKHFKTTVDIDGIADNLFFVWVYANKESTDAPCGMRDNSILGVTYDKYPFYLLGMNLLKEIGGCLPSSNLMDYILRNKAFDISILTGNYPKAIEYWNSFFKESDKKNVTNNCGCYGRFI